VTLSVDQFQSEQDEWRLRNFPGTKDSALILLGVMEELGELAHAHLKTAQGIRGTKEEHEIAARDSIGDMLVYMADYCNRQGWRLQEILEETWDEVKRRDWTANSTDGKVSSR